MIFGRIIPIVVPQAESKDLLFHFLQCEFLILTHPDVLLDLLILFHRDMDWAVITISQTLCDQHSISLIGLYFFLAGRFRHCSRGKNDTLQIMVGKLVVSGEAKAFSSITI